MVLLVTTSRILSAIETIPSSRRKDPDLDLPDSLDVNAPISHEQLIRISQYFKNNPDDNHGDNQTPKTLNSLLHGTRVYVPPPPKKPEPSPEYLAQKARLLAAAEADAYNRLITPQPAYPPHLSPSSHTTQGPSPFTSSSPMLSALHDPKNASTADDTDASDPLTPSLVLNIFLSVLLTGFSTYWALTMFRMPDLMVSFIASVWQPERNKNIRGNSEPVRVLFSLGIAILVGLAEVLIYAIYIKKAEHARSRERRLRERKVVVESEQVGGGEGCADTATPDDKVQKVDSAGGGQEEKIWGRGANGGIRRRVRERWEEQEKGTKAGGDTVSKFDE